MKVEPERWHKVDAGRSIEQVQDDIRSKVLPLLEDRP
jgi:thymidylate kinase